MKTRTIEVYRFAELPPAVRERIKWEHCQSFGYHWSEEAFDSLKKLAEHFDGQLVDWSVDFFDGSPSRATFRMPDMTSADIRRRLRLLGTYNRRTGKGHGECVLTGYCMDEAAIDGFRAAWRAGERNLDALMQAAFRSWLSEVQADAADEYSDECFADTADANGVEYLIDGHPAPAGAEQ